jgi:hypothetical protein
MTDLEQQLAEWIMEQWEYRTAHRNESIDWALADYRLCFSEIAHHANVLNVWEMPHQQNPVFKEQRIREICPSLSMAVKKEMRRRRRA